MKIFPEKSLEHTTIAQTKWYKTPSKAGVILVSLVWLTGNILMVMNRTDFFHKSFFVIRNLMTCFIMVFSTSILVNVYRNYYKNKRSGIE